MLRPTDTATRERKSLIGLWCFRLDGDGEGRTARWFDGPLPDAGRWRYRPASTTSPPTRRSATTSATSGTRRSCAFRVAGTASGSSLHFESATHRATVWVDDTEVVSHEGGYTPFEADVTEHVRAGSRRGSPSW